MDFSYKIIGADGREYGPVTVDELKGWIREGRAAGQTQVWRSDLETWRPAAAYDEFAFELASVPLPSAPAAPWPLELGSCLAGGARLMAANLGLFLAVTALAFLIELAVSAIPILGGVTYPVISGAIDGGLFLIVIRRMRGEPTGVKDLFTGFGPRFPQFMLAGIIAEVLIFAGFLCCLLPGIYLWAAWYFTLALVADRQLDFWAAMETSRKAVTRHFFVIFPLLVIAFLPALAYRFYGAMLLTEQMRASIGASGTLNLTQMLSHMDEFRDQAARQAFIGEVLARLIWPFACATMMHAYEVLFGPRSTPTA